MPTTLTATALPDQAAIRLNLESNETAGPVTVVKFETAFPSTEDTNWTFTTMPTGTTTTKGSSTLLTNRRLSMDVARTSAFPVLTTAHGVRRTLTGLIIGREYTLNIKAYTAAANGSGPAIPVRSTLGIVGIGATAPAVWTNNGQFIVYKFIATATSHVIAVSMGENFFMQEGSYVTWFLDHLRVDENTGVFQRTVHTLTRSDANGTASVRLFEDQDISGELLVLSDYEAALTGPVTYTAIVTTSTGTESATAAVTELGTTSPVLAPATMPQYSQFLPFVMGYDANRRAATITHTVIGRADPIVTLGPLELRTGTLDVLAMSHAEARLIEATYNRGEVVLLRQPTIPGLDMYHVALRTNIMPDETCWRISVSYVEVVAPTGPLLGSLGWTFDRAAAEYPTFAAARAAFPTFNDYSVGV